MLYSITIFAWLWMPFLICEVDKCVVGKTYYSRIAIFIGVLTGLSLLLPDFGAMRKHWAKKPASSNKNA